MLFLPSPLTSVHTHGQKCHLCRKCPRGPFPQKTEPFGTKDFRLETVKALVYFARWHTLISKQFHQCYLVFSFQWYEHESLSYTLFCSYRCLESWFSLVLSQCHFYLVND